MTHNFLAIDLGASSGRAMLGRLDGEMLSLAEVHRFTNGPMTFNGTLRWDVSMLEREIRRGVQMAHDVAGQLHGIGVDSWGVDYVLLDTSGAPVEPPFHYRDSRTATAMQRVCDQLGRQAIFARTGIQFLPFNTLFQLAAHDPHKLHHATGLLMMADYFAHRLGGRPVGEITLASTSQLLDARTRNWAVDLLAQLGLPNDLMPGLVEAGRIIGQYGPVPMFATAAHDTAAAVVGCPALSSNGHNDWAFLSCGTWSILGVELPEPVLTAKALALSLSNEAGVAGTTRLLGNIMGLWLLQECRRQWAEEGRNWSWQELVELADAAPRFLAVLDADDASFMAPGKMPEKIEEFCRRTGQQVPDSVGQFVRVILEALALKARYRLDQLVELTGRCIRTIHLVGGGANNRLLCQWTADATGRLVLAGPVEATAAGNVLTQAVGSGAIPSFADARRILRGSVNVDEYAPAGRNGWDPALAKLNDILQSGDGAA